MNVSRLGIAAATLIAVIVVAVALMWDAGSTAPESVQSGPAVTISFFRKPSPLRAFTFTDIGGRPIALADLRGKVVLVNFWATWCPPCREEIPDLVALQDKYKDHLQIIGISEDSGPEAVKPFAAANRINYPVIMETPEIEQLFPAVNALPTTFLVDREGRLVQKHVGMLNSVRTEVETRALAGLQVNATIEEVDDDDKVRLENAAQANKIPGLDLSPLSPEKKTVALQQLNSSLCTCGCRLTLAQCRIDDPSCNVSLPLARKLVEEIAKK